MLVTRGDNHSDSTAVLLPFVVVDFDTTVHAG